MSRRLHPRGATAAILALALAAASALVVPARADDDGGGRSLFATGAGNRALALGGAYAAVADDASAPLWNPGGLGFLSRAELQASHTNLIGLGFSEQFVALALPGWRWGSAALTARRFGVNGIDGRDADNLPLAGDLEDSETELGLAWARPFGGALAAGFNAKLRRQSLAGYAASGLGLDFGLCARPLALCGARGPHADDLSFGLAVRNAVEPSLRLDQEAVRDPLGVRVGLAWARPLGGARLLLLCDYERTRAMAGRLHAGLELQPAPLLALRTGLDDGELTAGAAVRWNGVAVEYAFADTRLEPLHRVGIALAFGRTVDESRRAAQLVQERELQARLARVFDTRQRARADSLAGRAAAALAAGRHDEALATLGLLRVIAPDEPQLAALETAALRGRARRLQETGDLAGAALEFGRALESSPADTSLAGELARCRAEGNERAARTVRLRALFTRALDAFAADSLASARAGFAEVVASAPEDRDAADMLRRVESALAARAATESAARQAREATARQTARIAVAPGLQAAPAAERPRLSAARRAELADLYRRGLAALQAGRGREAIGYWEPVWQADPEFEQVAGNLKREYLARGMESFAAGELDDAMRDWELARRIDPDDPRAAGYLERARQQQERIRRVLGGAS